MRIVISGYYGSKNAGDEAMLAAMIEVFRRLNDNVHITVISAAPEDTLARHHGVDAAVGFMNPAGIIKAITAADILLSGGGSLLQNVTSGRSLYYYIGVICSALVLRTPVMLYAQGIGPIYGSFARRIMKFVGNAVNGITVRDRGSLEELGSLGITKPPIMATADPVLAINPAELTAGKKILAANNVTGKRPIIGFAVREWRGWQHYKEVFAQTAAKTATELNADVVFLPMQYPEDTEVAKAVANRNDAQKDAGNFPVTVLPGEYTTQELLSLVGAMDLMVGIRLHALIFAGVMGVPMVGVSYDPKIDRFLASVGEKPAGDLASITVEDLFAEICRKWRRREHYRAKNAKLLQSLRELAIKNAVMAMEIADGEAHKKE